MIFLPAIYIPTSVFEFLRFFKFDKIFINLSCLLFFQVLFALTFLLFFEEEIAGIVSIVKRTAKKTEVDEAFLKIKLSGKVENNSSNVNGGKKKEKIFFLGSCDAKEIRLVRSDDY